MKFIFLAMMVNSIAAFTINAPPTGSSWGSISNHPRNAVVDTVTRFSRPSVSSIFMSSNAEEEKEKDDDDSVVADAIPATYSSSVSEEPINGEEKTTTMQEEAVENMTKDNNEQEIQLLLNDLLRIASSSGRGEFATSNQKEEASDIIESLEMLNPGTTDFDAHMQGRWELLYSSTQLFRSSPFFMAGRATCTTTEQAQQYDWFCDMHRAALAISTIGTVRQIIDTTEQTFISEFEVKVGSIPFLNDFVPFASYSGGLPATIDGAIVSSADIMSTNQQAGSYELLMDTVEIKGSNIPLLRQVLDMDQTKLESRALGSFLEQNVESYENPKPLFATTFLNDKYRVSRDQDGKVFVYGKESNESHLTDYTGVDSDLGLLKLVEGFNDAIVKFYI